MGDFLKLLLGGAAAFAIYEFFFANNSSSTTTTTTPTTTSTTPPPSATSNTTKDLVAAAAAAAGYGAGATLTSDQWCYYYAQARGVPCPALTNWPQAAGYKYTIDQWWAFVSVNGVSGLGGNYALSKYMGRRM